MNKEIQDVDVVIHLLELAEKQTQGNSEFLIEKRGKELLIVDVVNGDEWVVGITYKDYLSL